MESVGLLVSAIRSMRLRKARALMFYLLVEHPHSHRTDKLMDLFWQDAERDKAFASFRQVARHIRVALTPWPGVQLDSLPGGIALRLPKAGHVLERVLDEVKARLTEPEPDTNLRAVLEIVEEIQGISGSFDSWLAITKTRLVQGLQQRLDACLATPALARPAAELALRIEPAHEPAVRWLMRHDWQNGHATRAVERYNALYAHLDAEFDQEPEPETIALLAAIKMQPDAGRQALAAEPAVQMSITVDLTKNPNLGPGPASLAAVLCADLRLRLGRFREWRVIEQTGQTAVDLHLILAAHEIGPEFRLFVELRKPGDGHLLWSDCITNPSQNWESKARTMITGIANALSVVVAERSLSDRSADIYDRWLRSQVLLDTWSPANEGAALGLLQDITREAPRFGPAHAELAGALNVRHVLLPGTRQTEDIKELALHHAIEAVSIDPLDTRAHRVLAWCYCHKHEFGLAEFHFDQALALNRANTLTMVSAALGFAFADALARAAALAAEVRQHQAGQEPFHAIYLAVTDYLSGDFDRAEAGLAQGTGLMTTVGGWHAAALCKLGRHDVARQRLQTWLDEISPQWRGAGDVTAPAVLDWFTAIFPLRQDRVRDDLGATLAGLLRE